MLDMFRRPLRNFPLPLYGQQVPTILTYPNPQSLIRWKRFFNSVDKTKLLYPPWHQTQTHTS